MGNLPLLAYPLYPKLLLAVNMPWLSQWREMFWHGDGVNTEIVVPACKVDFNEDDTRAVAYVSVGPVEMPVT